MVWPACVWQLPWPELAWWRAQVGSHQHRHQAQWVALWSWWFREIVQGRDASAGGVCWVPRDGTLGREGVQKGVCGAGLLMKPTV